MAEGKKSFQVGIDFQSILRAISKQIYETPLAFIRENVQNAVDAIRIQALRENKQAGDPKFLVTVKTSINSVTVIDNGIGMSQSELQDYFWTIGASGKKTPEALKAGCVGMFGIGGFANFGICESLEVISNKENEEHGTLTSLSEDDIKNAGLSIPSVSVESSDLAGPRGTIVKGKMRKQINTEDLRKYLKDFVRFVPTKITFDGETISQQPFSTLDDHDNLMPLHSTDTEWNSPGVKIIGRIFEDKRRAIIVQVKSVQVNGQNVEMYGQLRFENGSIDVFKKGFKLCATQIGTSLGVTGRLDSNNFIPTAGRDSLDAVTIQFLVKIINILESIVVNVILENSERIAQHTRLFKYIINHNLVEKLTNTKVRLADGSETTLERIRQKSIQPDIGIYYATSRKETVSQIMQARGHVVVLLSGDSYRQTAEKIYLEKFCKAKPFDGFIDCLEYYTELTRFERIFLSELEDNISKGYEIKYFKVIAGRLTEDIPVYIKESTGNQPLEIFVDTRHPEVRKLEDLGYSQLLYSLISTFCREYLGTSLKKWSPKFFGDGALNLDLISKRRSELWVLLRNDIGVLNRNSGQRQVVRGSDVGIVNVHSQAATPGNPKPRILQIVDDQGTTGLAGFYLRLPDTAYIAYGDLFSQCEYRGIVWAGNKIQYIVSDAVSSAFQYEIRLDEIITTSMDGILSIEGSMELKQSLQELYGSIYFPIPEPLKNFLVPQGASEIRLELHSEWIDMKTSKQWAAQDETEKA